MQPPKEEPKMTNLPKPIDAAAAARLREQGALMVDVREPGEHARGHIPLSQNLPLSRLEVAPLAAGGSQAVVFYCASGNRTTVAAGRLAAKAGGAPGYVLSGGFSAWVRAGLPVERARPDGAEDRPAGRGFFSRWLGL